MTVEALKEIIAALPAEDRHSLTAWLNDLEYDDWDKQMVQDFSAGGRGAAWAEKVRRDIAEGNATSFEAGRTQAKEQQKSRL
jgi:hypothetical protein